MIYMIKKFFISSLILLLSSCTTFSASQYSELYKASKSLFFSNATEITQDYYDTFNYSFAQVKIGRGPSAILSLVSIDNGYYEWVSSENIKIITLSGRIVRTIGLPHDAYRSSALLNNCCTDLSSIEPIRLYSPDLFGNSLVTNLEIEKNIPLSYLEESIQTKLIKESYSLSEINWMGTNLYYFDDSFRPILTLQKIHPYLDEIRMQFFYK